MRNINIMSGICGSGKSYFADNYSMIGSIVLHRDDFRAMLREREGCPEDYYPVSARQEWKEWIDFLRANLTRFKDNDIWIDQTTLTNKALSKLLRAISPYIDEKDNITVNVCWCDVETAKKRNSLRLGFARVPETVIDQMHRAMHNDPIHYETIHREFPSLSLTVRHLPTGWGKNERGQRAEVAQ